MTVADLLRRMPAAEITEWIAYERLRGPLGPVRGDWQAAVVASTVYHANAGKKTRKRKLRDFLPKWVGGRKVQDVAEMEALGRQFAAMYGGTFVEAGGDRE